MSSRIPSRDQQGSDGRDGEAFRLVVVVVVVVDESFFVYLPSLLADQEIASFERTCVYNETHPIMCGMVSPDHGKQDLGPTATATQHDVQYHTLMSIRLCLVEW